jgi:hypothetical protein
MIASHLASRISHLASRIPHPASRIPSRLVCFVAALPSSRYLVVSFPVLFFRNSASAFVFGVPYLRIFFSRMVEFKEGRSARAQR